MKRFLQKIIGSTCARCVLTLGALFLLSYCTPSNKNSCPSEEAKQSSDQGQWLKAAQLYEQCLQLNGTDEKANYNTGTNYLKANRPQKALAIFNAYDAQKSDATIEMGKREARIAKAYYQTGQYQKVLEMAQKYPYPKMYRGLAREELKSIIQLKRFELLAQQFAHYQHTGIYSEPDKKTSIDFLYKAICNELSLVKEDSLLHHYAQAFQTWISKQAISDSNSNHAFAAYYLQNYEAAISHLGKAIKKEKSSRQLIELTMLRGVCYAKMGNAQKAQLQTQQLLSYEDPPTRHDAFGIKSYYQARIETALGQKEAAVQSLKKALKEGAEFWSYRFKEDAFLADLFGYPAYEELI